MASGCFICVNIILVIILIDISSFVISGGILFKILVLGINEMALCLSSEVLKGLCPYFWFTRPIFLLNY
jgi:hypothetical protein